MKVREIHYCRVFEVTFDSPVTLQLAVLSTGLPMPGEVVEMNGVKCRIADMTGYDIGRETNKPGVYWLFVCRYERIEENPT